MKLYFTSMSWAAVCFAMLTQAQEVSSVTTLKALEKRTDRGALSDERQIVRGDSGKWNDKATLQHAPPIQQKPQGMSLDDWADQLVESKLPTKADEDKWILFRSRTLDDNDRVWVDKVERRGREFIVHLNEAVWQGRYNKTFTYYEVVAVNLGKLPPGNYTVKWVVHPMTFKQLEKPQQPNKDNKENWPIDEQLSARKPYELKVEFSVQ